MLRPMAWIEHVFKSVARIKYAETCSCLGMCVSRSSQDKKLVSPVFAAHMLSSGLPFELRDDYEGNPLPAGEQPAILLYEHLQFYVDKVRVDLKNIGEWDRTLQHVT